MRGATGVTIQPHQILPLSGRKTHLLNHPYIWNRIYNARSNRCHHPTSPNTAPATKNDSYAWSSLNMKLHFQCAEQQVSPSNLTKYCACHTKRLTFWVLITYETSFTMRRATGVTIKPHQILRLPRKMTPMLDPHYIWNFISNAQSNRCHHQNSPNTAPVTQKDSHSESSSHMKPHLQCAEQLVSPSNLTKYCACHEKWLLCLILVTYETSFPISGATGVTIQPHQILRLPRKMTLQDFKDNLQKQVKRHFQCGDDPSMIRPWKRKPQPASPPRLLFELTTSIFYWKIQRFAPNLTFKPSPNTAPATKSDTSTSRSTAPATKSDTWTSPSTAPATKSDIWTSPNTAPATKNDSYAWSSLHMKPHFQCAEQQVSLPNLTKYCACHEKWHCEISKQVKRHFQCGDDPSMIRPWKRKPQPASPPRLLFELTTSIFYWKIQRFAPKLQTFTKYCACHEKSH